ncbi:MAG: DinB family protein [Bacteroidia bacterium]|nr:DinB family protein [Bacteroidia bacterium]
MEIKDTSSQVLEQLVELINKLDNEQFARPLSVLSGNTIGKHIRHIIELYEQLLLGYDSGVINYDQRKRDLQIETETNYAIDKLKQINLTAENKSDKPVQLMLDYSINCQVNDMVDSSYKRELAYNIEHAIHHMAIIKIAIENAYSEIVLDKAFGVAPSTIRFQRECVQ